MNMLRAHTRVSFRAGLALALLFSLASCASTPQRIAYTSINAAVDAVQTGLKVWNEAYYIPGMKVDPVTWNANRDKVQASYVKFQASAQLATTLAQDVTQKANALQIVNDAAAPVIALLQSFGK